MKKKLVMQVLVIAVAITGTVGYTVTLKKEIDEGSVTLTYSEYNEERMDAFVREQFGDCETLEEMLEQADRYVCNNFDYDYELAEGYQIQYTDVERTIRTNKGICYDFSMFVKVCANVFAQQKGIPAKAYTAVCTELKGDGRHAYNYVVCDERCYYVDSTFDNSAQESGCEIFGVFELKEMSMEEHSRWLGYRIDGLR